MDYSAVLEILDGIIYDQTKVKLLKSDGKVDWLKLAPLIGNKIPASLCKSVRLDTKGGDEEEVSFNVEADQLIISMPKTLRDKVAFAVEYIISEFDKINSDINRLSLQFQIDRLGVVKNAEDVLKSVCAEGGLSNVSIQTLIQCRQDLGNSLRQLS